MTGLITPTSGDCIVDQASIVSQTEEARLGLGYCPQSNVMYGALTVIEHLQIYAAIKGIPGGAWSVAAVQAAEAMIEVRCSASLDPPHQDIHLAWHYCPDVSKFLRRI